MTDLTALPFQDTSMNDLNRGCADRVEPLLQARAIGYDNQVLQDTLNR